MIKNHIHYSNFLDWRFTITKAEGSYLWDEKGRKIIDFTSAWNVTNLGWNNPKIHEAIRKQLDIGSITPMWADIEIQDRCAENLVSLLPKHLDIIVRTVSGTESNEKAMMFARIMTGRSTILGFVDTFHGQSFGTMSIGYRPEYVVNIAPMVGGFEQLQFPSVYPSEKSETHILSHFIKKLEERIAKKDVAAIIMEAGLITGWGSTAIGPVGLLREVRRVTEAYGTLLILDEVGTGFGRLGTMFGMEKESVVPDIATFAKGLTNGAVTMGALAVRSDVLANSGKKLNPLSTFAWLPLGCAAAAQVMTICSRDRVWETAQKNGTYLLRQLQEKLETHPKIGNIRGIGMEIGITFIKNEESIEGDNEYAMKVVNEAFVRGLHLATSSDGNIQIMPPLTTSKSILDDGVKILEETISVC